MLSRDMHDERILLLLIEHMTSIVYILTVQANFKLKLTNNGVQTTQMYPISLLHHSLGSFFFSARYIKKHFVKMAIKHTHARQ